MEKKFLFYGGIIGPLVFLLNDIIGSIITKGYNPIINAVSELTQAGAEHAYLLSLLFLIAALFLVIFGIGIFLKYKDRRHKLIFIGSIAIMLLGSFSGLSGTIFPMDHFNVDSTFAGTMHIVLTGLNIVLLILALLLIGIGLYEEKQWKFFRLYSVLTVLIMVIFGALTSALVMNDIELLGLFERVTIYAYQLWLVILAILLIKEKSKQTIIE